MLPTKFYFILGSGLRREYFIQKSTNQVIYRPRKFVFAIRLGSMLTIVICYVLYLQYCVLLWSMTFYTYDFCITKNRCMIDQTYHFNQYTEVELRYYVCQCYIYIYIYNIYSYLLKWALLTCKILYEFILVN
jgi:hypothetical protein